jgi:hypothetical protein
MYGVLRLSTGYKFCLPLRPTCFVEHTSSVTQRSGGLPTFSHTFKTATLLHTSVNTESDGV